MKGGRVWGMLKGTSLSGEDNSEKSMMQASRSSSHWAPRKLRLLPRKKTTKDRVDIWKVMLPKFLWDIEDATSVAECTNMRPESLSWVLLRQHGRYNTVVWARVYIFLRRNGGCSQLCLGQLLLEQDKVPILPAPLSSQNTRGQYPWGWTSHPYDWVHMISRRIQEGMGACVGGAPRWWCV